MIQSKLHPVILGIDFLNVHKKVQVGNNQKKAQSEKDSIPKTEVGKNLINNQVLIPRNISLVELAAIFPIGDHAVTLTYDNVRRCIKLQIKIGFRQ